jgi:AbiU2
MAESDLEKWTSWYADGIESDVFNMHLQRFVWLRVHEIAKDNADLGTTPSYLWDWLFDIYTKTQAQAVRRQADKDRRAGCLARIIIEIGERPESVEREWWLSMTESDDSREEERHYWRRVYEGHWQDQFGGGEHFDPVIAEGDLARLQDESRKVREYVNSHVAHLDARVLGGRLEGQLPTLDEVHEAIDLVGEYFNKYGFLLTGASWHRLTPVLQHDWEAVFRMPWIKPPVDEGDLMWRAYRARLAAEDESDP